MGQTGWVRAVGWMGLCTAWATAASAAPLTVEEAVARVAQTHPEVLAERALAAAARAAEKSGRGHLLPALHISDKQLFTFTKPGESGFAGLLASGAGIPVAAGANAPRNFSANVMQLSAMQPLLGLFAGAHAWKALGYETSAARLGARRRQELVEGQVRTGYLQLFEALALRAAAAEAQADLQEQANMAAKKVEAGSLTQADVLRVRVAAANATHQVIGADAQAATLRAALVEMLGLDETHQQAEFAPPDNLLQDPAVPALETSREQAQRLRLDVRQGTALARASEKFARAKSWTLIPEVNLLAAYVFTSVVPIRSSLPGGPAMIHTGLVGLNLDWAIWEWGTQWYAVREAEAKARVAHHRLDGLRHQVAAEVAARHHALVAARAAVEVSALQVEAATEAYRVVRALVGAASATTTDLLDAQSALATARSRHVQHRYQAAMARVALDVASSAPTEHAATTAPPPLAPPERLED